MDGTERKEDAAEADKELVKKTDRGTLLTKISS